MVFGDQKPKPAIITTTTTTATTTPSESDGKESTLITTKSGRKLVRAWPFSVINSPSSSRSASESEAADAPPPPPMRKGSILADELHVQKKASARLFLIHSAGAHRVYSIVSPKLPLEAAIMTPISLSMSTTNKNLFSSMFIRRFQQSGKQRAFPRKNQECAGKDGRKRSGGSTRMGLMNRARSMLDMLM